MDVALPFHASHVRHGIAPQAAGARRERKRQLEGLIRCLVVPGNWLIHSASLIICAITSAILHAISKLYTHYALSYTSLDLILS